MLLSQGLFHRLGVFRILPEHTGNQSHDRTTEKSRRRQWTWSCLNSQEALAPVFTSAAFLDLGQVRFPFLPLSGDRAEGGRRKDLITRHKRKSFCSTCDGNASGPRFTEGFCEVTCLLRPGWGVGTGQAKSRVKGAPGIGPGIDKGLEVKVSKQNLSQKPRKDQRGFSRQGGKGRPEAGGAGGARSRITWSLT